MPIHQMLLPSLLVALLWCSCGPGQGGAPQPSPWQLHFRAGEEALQQGDYLKAQHSFEAARGELADAADSRLVPTLQRLAGLHALQGRLAPAESLYTQALALAQHLLPRPYRELIALETQTADFYLDQKNYPKAEALYTQALAHLEDQADPRPPQLAGLLNRLAELHLAQGHHSLADSLGKRAMACKLGAQGYEYYLQGKYAQAETFYRRALAIHEKALGDHPELARTLDNLALLLKKSKRDEEAQAAEDRARQLRQTTPIPVQESR